MFGLVGKSTGESIVSSHLCTGLHWSSYAIRYDSHYQEMAVEILPFPKRAVTSETLVHGPLLGDPL